MIVDKGNEAHVHHALLYECQDLSQAALDWQGDCSYDDTMPLDLKGCNGGAPIAGWAIGGEDFWLPPNVGIRFGKTGGRFMLLETHYDNPDQFEGVVDSSGLRLWLTPNLREHDASYIAVGPLVPTIIVPPFQQDFALSGLCTSECVSAALKQAGQQSITVFASLLHAHLAGRSIKTTVIRNGKERAVLNDNKLYDFNYQNYDMLKDQVTITAEDSLNTTCGYPSAPLVGKKKPTSPLTRTVGLTVHILATGTNALFGGNAREAHAHPNARTDARAHVGTHAQVPHAKSAGRHGGRS